MTIPLAPVDPVQTTAVGQRILDAASTLFYERGITATIERDPGPFDTAHIASRLILDTQHGPQPPK